jgi:cytidine deaminase
MKQEVLDQLLEQAKKAANNNFCCPHTKYTVGAALLTKDGKVYTGFNVENAGIQSICAERVAFAKALTAMNKEFLCIMVVGKNLTDERFKKTLPCGYCRQFMTEYVEPNFLIYAYDETENKIYSYELKDLLPESYEF